MVNAAATAIHTGLTVEQISELDQTTPHQHDQHDVRDRRPALSDTRAAEEDTGTGARLDQTTRARLKTRLR